jgi:hypothetical protein
MEQPWWYAELIYEVLPVYESHRDAAKQRAMWGSGDSGGKGKGDQNTSNGGTQRQGKPKRRRR